MCCRYLREIGLEMSRLARPSTAWNASASRRNNDQDIFKKLLPSFRATENASIVGLSALTYRNGYNFYENRSTLRGLNVLRLAAVHHNFIVGDDNKWDRAVWYDTVLASDNETRKHFLGRAIEAMHRKPQWKYRDRTHVGNAGWKAAAVQGLGRSRRADHVVTNVTPAKKTFKVDNGINKPIQVSRYSKALTQQLQNAQAQRAQLLAQLMARSE